MILTGNAIAEAVRDKRIIITPYSADALGPDSYDLRLGPEIIRYQEGVLDAKVAPRTIKQTLPAAGITLQAGEFVLGHSAETVASDHFAALIHARSSIARLGLFVHVTSDLIHVGSSGHITFQLYATMPVTIKPGMRIAQITFWVPKGEITLYRGKYYQAQGPQPSALFQDFLQDPVTKTKD